MDKNYKIILDSNFQNDTQQKIREEVNSRISWKTDMFEKEASLLISGGNTGLKSNGIMGIGYGFQIHGVKSYPYQIKGYFDSDIEFEDAEGNYSSEIYANSIEKMIDGFLSYLYTLEQQFTNE